jgi:hypothetical protein
MYHDLNRNTKPIWLVEKIFGSWVKQRCQWDTKSLIPKTKNVKNIYMYIYSHILCIDRYVHVHMYVYNILDKCVSWIKIKSLWVNKTNFPIKLKESFWQAPY